MNQYRTVVVADHHKTVFVCRILDTHTGETELKKLPATRDLLRDPTTARAARSNPGRPARTMPLA